MNTVKDPVCGMKARLIEEVTKRTPFVFNQDALTIGFARRGRFTFED